MAPSADVDDIPELDVSQFLKGATRGKYHARYMAALAASGVDVSGPIGDEPTTGLSDETSQSARLDALLIRFAREWRPWADRTTIAVWATYNDDWIEIAGTGTLFSVGGSHFLITAAHVFEAGRRPGWVLWLVDPDLPDPPMLQFRGRAVTDPQADVLVWELPPDVVIALPSRRYLLPYNVDPKQLRVGDGLYGFTGYLASDTQLPTSGDRFCGDVSRISQVGTPYKLSPGLNGTLDPARHFLLGNRWPGQVRVGNEPVVAPVRLAGVSGCPIWHLYHPAMPAALWTRNFPAVVAVQTHVNYQLGYIRGTRWWVVDQLIREGWPHLAPALSLEVPGPHPAGV